MFSDFLLHHLQIIFTGETKVNLNFGNNDNNETLNIKNEHRLSSEEFEKIKNNFPFNLNALNGLDVNTTNVKKSKKIIPLQNNKFEKKKEFNLTNGSIHLQDKTSSICGNKFQINSKLNTSHHFYLDMNWLNFPKQFLNTFRNTISSSFNMHSLTNQVQVTNIKKMA